MNEIVRFTVVFGHSIIMVKICNSNGHWTAWHEEVPGVWFKIADGLKETQPIANIIGLILS